MLCFLKRILGKTAEDRKAGQCEPDQESENVLGWRESLEIKWTGSLLVHFGYKWGEERNRRDVTLEKIFQNDDKNYYLYGFCHLRNEYRHFNTHKISSKVKVPAHKKYYHAEELIEMLLGIPSKNDELQEPAYEFPAESFDDLYKAAVEIAIKERNMSISLLQRRLKIGFSKAARLVEKLEYDGIIGPADGANPRLILK